ncbi:tryptophan halogenase family protein [Streptomyces olivaceus]
MNDIRIKDVVILGGGTAGWMTASYLGKALQGTVNITLLEAPTIPRIGVGEATVPNLQSAFFDYLGIPEQEWMRECNASFKTGIRFVNWRTSGNGSPEPRDLAGGTDHFYHHFANLPEHDHVPLSHYWDFRRRQGEQIADFDRECFGEAAALDAKRGPWYADGTPATGYAWHFDAQLVADYLRRFATRTQGTRHVQDELVDVVLDDRGHIESLLTKGGLELRGDLFVDCSGFRGLLINKALGEPFLDMSDHLLCDSAVATAVPHDDEKNGIEPFTSAIAMSSGWTWKIPMLTRFGSGYVYSSKFIEKDTATKEFCDLWGLDPTRTEFNHVKFRVGRNRRAWVKNCVSIGLSSCFVEPLESTGIYFIYSAVYQLAKHFPDKRFDPVLVNHFNREIESMFDFTRDFIQTHFYFSPRNDTEFWRANKELPLGDDIREKIELYRAGLPVNSSVTGERVYYGNSEVENKNFWNNTNYWCIFAGLGFLPDRVMPSLTYKSASLDSVETVFGDVRRREQHLLDKLPATRDILRSLHHR